MIARVVLSATLFAAILVGCATAPSDERISAEANAMIKASFKARGQAGLDRLDQDETQRLCSQAAGKTPPKDVAERIEKQNLATIRYPADGKLIGDWKNGERIAQDGRGKQYSDDPAGPVGGNCYACHQLAPQELAYGTIGPSLYRFGKLRGYGVETQRYVYGKVFNSEAFAACSTMPRFGHNGILSEQQIKDVTALLMDPASPVNQ
ncbi:MAG TPA: sulfur oxidation c-type cytochrome SoxX [Casimicrobiaceae bacterium]|jgi:sulfur-oxidizing protein SoxX|nr:sulfur oxidation c-type cytochrome SoxX [Casimicrobiaceae bacterium]